MKKITDDIIKKIEKLGVEVETNFRRKGVAIPVKNEDGSITMGYYTIVKNSNNLFDILDYSNEPVVAGINLAQSAVLVANDLALGKFINKSIVEKDRNYGYALFEEQLVGKFLRKKRRTTMDRKEVLLTKCLIAQAKKNFYKTEISRSFEKLRSIV
jgi:aminopeptidase-like protein